MPTKSEMEMMSLGFSKKAEQCLQSDKEFVVQRGIGFAILALTEEMRRVQSLPASEDGKTENGPRFVAKTVRRPG